ncbi:MAG: (2Fe-2S) ferredoxin domain-containing protein, partial [Candidatus Sumerlaeaceae bacterium]
MAKGKPEAKKIRSAADLDKIKALYLKARDAAKFRLLVCAGAGCVSSGCMNVRRALEAELQRAGLAHKTLIHETGCLGSCHLGPTLVV